MAGTASLSEGLKLSISTLAAELGMTRETVAKRISAANVVPAGKRAGHPVYRLRDVLKPLVMVSEDGEDDPDKLDPYRRQAHYKAELQKLQLETETREVIPRIEVEEEQARILRVVALMLDTLPDVLERDCGLSSSTVTRVEKVLDQVRDGLHKTLTEDEGEAVA
jgi:hypothetical protein